MGSLSGFFPSRSHAISFNDAALRDSSLDSLWNYLGRLILRFLILGLVFKT